MNFIQAVYADIHEEERSASIWHYKESVRDLPVEKMSIIPHRYAGRKKNNEV